VLGWQSVDGILIDLGVSSMQLDTPERGFSFQTAGPLDMRFNPNAPISADEIINTWGERELSDIFWQYGEEPQARRLAKAIVQDRPLHNTRDLAELAARVCRTRDRKSATHPATRIFQALRIAVNRELEAVETFLPQAVAALAPGGRLAVIAFHSLEDRIAKQYFRLESRDCICPSNLPVCVCQHHASIVEVNRRPITAGESETHDNPRARSARLRIVEKL